MRWFCINVYIVYKQREMTSFRYKIIHHISACTPYYYHRHAWQKRITSVQHEKKPKLCYATLTSLNTSQAKRQKNKQTNKIRYKHTTTSYTSKPQKHKGMRNCSTHIDAASISKAMQHNMLKTTLTAPKEHHTVPNHYTFTSIIHKQTNRLCIQFNIIINFTQLLPIYF